MCKRKPGPRCYNHAKPKLEKTQARVEEVEASYQQALADVGGDKSQMGDHWESARAGAYADRYEAMRQYYSTPRARDELKSTVIPQAERNLAEAESRYNADPSEANKRSRTTARAEHTKYRNLLTHGERRWSQSNADLRTNEMRRSALNRGDFEAAQYDNVDLSRASSWDTLNSKPKWSKDRMWARRQMQIETPTQERISAVSDVHIKGHKSTGYYVETTTHASFGATEKPQSSGSALPDWQNRDGKRVTKDSKYAYTKVRTLTERSGHFGSYAEAHAHAKGLAGGGEHNTNVQNHIPAQLAKHARARAVGQEARRHGIKSQEDYNRHMAAMREEQRQRRAQELAEREKAAPVTGTRATAR